MYYKIVKEKSEVYKKLYALRIKENEIEARNLKALECKIGLEWDGVYGRHGQQNFKRVTCYSGFEFKEPTKVDEKIWKRHYEHNTYFVPNTRTKLGREMQEFLNKLERSRYDIIDNILGLESLRRFKFPFVEIIGKEIILFLDDQHNIDNKDIIEITKREFTDLQNSYRFTE